MKPLDKDIRALKGAIKALNLSTSKRMLWANLNFLHEVIKDGERVDVIAEREGKTKRIKRRIRVDD